MIDTLIQMLAKVNPRETSGVDLLLGKHKLPENQEEAINQIKNFNKWQKRR